MHSPCRLLRALLFLGILPATTLPAQTSVSLDLAYRIEVMFRSHAELPPAATVQIGPRTSSELPGYDQVTVTYTADGTTSHPIPFVISPDNKTIAQFTRFDIATAPRTLISEQNRPSRGGPVTAPVSIVGFDDLECPFCARLNAMLPAILARYKDQVRIVYRDSPIDEHPWSMRAAVDTSCIGRQSAPAYWTAVDAIHLQAADLGGPERSLAKANASIDSITRKAGLEQKVDTTALNACIDKQDETAVRQSQRESQALGVASTPTLFINGAKVVGAVPLEFLYSVIDKAMLAQGIQPPATSARP